MGTDAYHLLWGGEPRPKRGRPAVLSRTRIVAEAVAIAGAEGLAAVSMKRLADRLDSGVMSLYRHVPSKDELVALMYDATMATPPALATDRGWRAAMLDWAHACRDLFLTHPWVLPLATANHAMGPHEAAWVDSILGRLADAGLPADVSLASVLAVNSYIGGAVRPQLQAGQEPPQWFRFLDDPTTHDRYPNAARLITEGSLGGSAILDDFVEFGLQRVLDGLAQYIEQSGSPDR
jgi:AcrR family transcriptional regulator